VGYAFINFVQPADMTRFAKKFSGYRFKDHVSQKIARVSPAHLQGFEENVAHFNGRAVTHSRFSQYRPVILDQSNEQTPSAAPLPPPSKDTCLSTLKATAEEFVPAETQARTAMPTQQLPTLYSSWAGPATNLAPPPPSQRPTLSTSPSCQTDVQQRVDLDFRTQDVQSSFSFAKLELEMAVSKLLQQGRQVSEVSGTSSTEGASQSASSSTSPRSASPLAGPQDLSDAKLNFPPGLWPEESLEFHGATA